MLSVSNTHKNVERVKGPDISRGLAMLFIIEWHTVGLHIDWVDTWAMPVFFLIVGVFYKPTKSFPEMIKKKSKTILLPFFLLSIPAYIVSIFSSPSNFLHTFINPYKCVHGPGWFLIAMFWTYLIFYGVLRLTNGYRLLRLIVCIAISCLFYYLSTFIFLGHRIILPFFATVSFVSIVLVEVGYELRKFIVKKNRLLTGLLIGLPLAIVGFILSYNHPSVEFVAADWGGQSYFKWLSLSLVGTISIIYLSSLCPPILDIILGFIGKHSLLFLMIHPYLINLLSIVGVSGWSLYVLVTILTFVVVRILLAIQYASNRHIFV